MFVSTDYEVDFEGKKMNLSKLINTEFVDQLYVIMDKEDFSVKMFDRNFEYYYGIVEPKDITIFDLYEVNNLLYGKLLLHGTLYFKFTGWKLDLIYNSMKTTFEFIAITELEVLNELDYSNQIDNIHKIAELKNKLFRKDRMINLASETFWVYNTLNDNIDWYIGERSEFKILEKYFKEIKNFKDWENIIKQEDKINIINGIDDILKSNKNNWEYQYSIILNNKEFFIHDIAKIERINNGNIKLIFGSIKNITSNLKTNEEIIYKNSLLKTIQEIYVTLSNRKTWYDNITNAFNLIADTIEIDRVYFFERKYNDENCYYEYNQRVEWSKENAIPQINNPELQGIPSYLVESATLEYMEKGIFNKIVSKLPDTFLKELLLNQDIKSIIICPLIVNGEEFGFIGFDECKNERLWLESEIDFLKIIANILSKFIDNNEDKINIATYKIKYTTLVENIEDGYCFLNTDFNIIEWNKSATKITRLDKIEVINRNFWNAFPSLNYGRLAKLLKSNNYFEKKLNMIYISEINKWVNIKIIYEDNKHILIFNNITESSIGKKSDIYQNYFANHIGILAIGVNSSSEIEWANKEFLNFINTEISTLYKQSIKNINNYFELQINLKLEFDKFKNSNDKMTNLYTILIDEKGNSNHFEIKIKRIKVIGSKDKFIIVFNEVADEKSKDIDSINQNEIFYKEFVINATKDLQETNNKLNSIIKDKQILCNIVTHDLISPINALSLNLDIMKSRFQNIDLNEREELYKIFENSFKIINSISKDLSKIGILNKTDLSNEKLTKFNVKADEYIKTKLEHYKVIAQNKKINIISQLTDNYINIDARTFDVIFSNLISNAIKFSPFGKDITVKLDLRDDLVYLSVMDNGPGLNEDDKLNIFNAYKKLSAKPTNNEVSSGLGLFITKNLVEFNKGEIYFESKLGKGTTFYVKLPNW
jgi:signal transduction histidine kinase/PAS domain-containing protein